MPTLARRFGAAVLLLALAMPASAQRESVLPALIPMPTSVARTASPSFLLTAATPIRVEADTPAHAAEAERIAAHLRALVGVDQATLLRLPSDPVPEAAANLPPVTLRIAPDGDLGAEGYRLGVTLDGVEIAAAAPAGLFYGVQTLRQLLPPAVEYGAVLSEGWTVPAVQIEDRPRFVWRGAMLDVSRHFFGVDDVKRYLDLMALYKLNRLHLHLSDDQGWRIEIPGWPALTEVGGRTEVGGGEGGYYTVADYDEIVRYAAERFIMIVPEIDLPGHTNAALVAVPELNCDGVARAPYTGIRVGFSTVCVDKEETYAFVDDVVRELAARTPGDVIHLGGDEVHELEPETYVAFMERAQAIVARHGKTFAGWDEVAEVDLDLAPGAIVQVWRPQTPETAAHIADAVAAGARLVLSPAEHIYLDIKYDSTTAIGLTWAGLNSVEDAYAWDPSTLVAGVPEAAILGVEAPLWSETLDTIRDIEFMAFPRLAGVAEIGWSRLEDRDGESYRRRLGAHGRRWVALGVNFYRSPDIPWEGAP
ncbi:MAG: beta-N-acetylhexosaminidase [Bacteroidota bacterium]